MTKNYSAKVAIIGAGKVGATTAFSLMLRTDIDEIVLVDTSYEKAEGEAMDLQHGLAFIGRRNIYAGSYDDIKNADYIIITAGVSQKPGETRIDLAARNIKILQEIMTKCVAVNNSAVYMIVSNPVDVLTYAAFKISGLPRSQIFGSGTNLDSSRMRYLIGQQLKLNPKEVNAYILGEHGDSEFLLKSQIDVSGISLGSLKKPANIDLDSLYTQTRDAAYEVIKRKEATYYAIALSVTDMVGEMIHDQNAVNPVSVCLEGEYKLYDVALSVPVILGRSGIKEVIEVNMTVEEEWELQKSAKKLQDIYKQITG